MHIVLIENNEESFKNYSILLKATDQSNRVLEHYQNLEFFRKREHKTFPDILVIIANEDFFIDKSELLYWSQLCTIIIEDPIKKFSNLNIANIYTSACLNFSFLANIIDHHPNVRSSDKINIKYGDKIHTIDVSEIAYAYTLEGVTIIVTKNNNSFPTSLELSTLATMIRNLQFVWINQNLFAHIDSIERIDKLKMDKRYKLTLVPPYHKPIFLEHKRIKPFMEWLKTMQL